MDVSGEENVKSEERLDTPAMRLDRLEEREESHPIPLSGIKRWILALSHSDKLNLTVLTFCPRN